MMWSHDVVDVLAGSEQVPQRALKDEPLQEEPVLVVDRVIEPEPLDRGAHALRLGLVTATDEPLGRDGRHEEDHEGHERDHDEEQYSPEQSSDEVSEHRLPCLPG